MNKRLSMPDGMRVIAIGLVMAFHIWQQSWLWPKFDIGPLRVDLSDTVATGYMWVDVMLLLSGMLLYMPIARGGGLEIKRYYTRRLIRILPNYLLAIAVIMLAFNLPGRAYGNDTRFLWKDLLSHLTFTHTFWFDTYIASKLNVALWTLAVEMQFYFIFPFVAKCFKKWPVQAYMIMVSLAHLCRYFIIPALEPINMYINCLPAMLDVYANGMLAAFVLAKLEKHDFRWYIKLAFLAGMCVAAQAMYHAIMGHSKLRYSEELIRAMSQMDARFLMTFSCAALMVFGECSFAFIKKVFSNPVTRFLCAISFNVYIWHQYMAVKFREWNIPWSALEFPNREGDTAWQIKYTILCFAAALVFAAVVYYVYERPADRILTKLNRRILQKTKPYYIIRENTKRGISHELP